MVTEDLFVSPKVLRMWPTPIVVSSVTDDEKTSAMNAALQTLVLDAERAEQDPLVFGVIGATKTSLDILRWDEPSIRWLKGKILGAIKEISRRVGADQPTDAKVQLVVEGWAVVYRSGGSHRLHTHHESAWSGVYYISTGGVGGDAGHLQVLDPRPAAIARQATAGVSYVEPRPGMLVCFPSWLPHSVKATLEGGGERICIAFNAGYVDKQEDD